MKDESNGGADEQTLASRRALTGYVQRVFFAVGITVVTLLLLTFIWFTARVWLVVFAGVLLAIFLRAISDWFSAKLRLGKGLALALTVVLLTGMFALLVWLMAPQAVEQFDALLEQVPKATAQVEEKIGALGLERFIRGAQESEPDLVGGAGKIAGRVAGFFTVTFGAIVSAVVIVFLGLYLAATSDTYVSGFARLFPVTKRPRVLEILAQLAVTLRHWLLGQIASMAAVGLLIGVGLKILGVPMAFTLGILAGVLDFIPIIGPLISAVPAVLLGFTISPLWALYVIALFVLVNTVIESHLIVPLVQRYAVSLPPAITIVALVLMGQLFGFLGLLLATPLAAAALVLVKMLYVQDVLGDKTITIEEKKGD